MANTIFYKICEDDHVKSNAIYTTLGINIGSRKNVLELYIADSERTNFWLQVLTNLSNSGVNDILISCIDRLNGLLEAIESIFPKIGVQLCVIQQIRNSFMLLTKIKKNFLKILKKYRYIYKRISKNIF